MARLIYHAWLLSTPLGNGGLQQAAGSDNVLELHGLQRHLEARRGLLRRASSAADVPQKAIAEAQACDLFLVVGSSLVVQPAAGLPVAAHRNGARVVIINRDPTPLDRIADLVFHERAAQVLSTVV